MFGRRHSGTSADRSIRDNSAWPCLEQIDKVEVMRSVLALCALTFVLGLSSGEQRATVTASAYNSLLAQTDGNPNEGAWGDEIKPGMKVIAVSPDLLESGLDRGTEVQIEGLRGTWTVLDRTASRHRNRIDIYMGIDVDAAIAWGLQKVTISWSPAKP